MGGNSTPPGAEYGEGLLQFLSRGGVTRLDVDLLNDRLRARGAARCRHAMRPDEAHGLVFDWDDVVAPSASCQLAAWRDLAREQGRHLPSGFGSARSVLDQRPEHVVSEVLSWTQERGVARALARRLGELYLDRVALCPAPLPGVAGWLAAAARHRVPCALVTRLDSSLAGRVLERWGLGTAFVATLAAEAGAETHAERLLCAVCALDRPPERCVLFSALPAALTAAHNCTMRAVAVAGRHPAYALAAADATVASLADLSVVNIRRLFANEGSRHMDLQRQREERGRRCRPWAVGTGDPPP